MCTHSGLRAQGGVGPQVLTLYLTIYCECRQGHLEDAIAQSQQRAEEAEELRVLLEKKTCKELEGLKATYAVQSCQTEQKKKSRPPCSLAPFSAPAKEVPEKVPMREPSDDRGATCTPHALKEPKSLALYSVNKLSTYIVLCSVQELEEEHRVRVEELEAQIKAADDQVRKRHLPGAQCMHLLPRQH
jgi:hypothetical protein